MYTLCQQQLQPLMSQACESHRACQRVNYTEQATPVVYTHLMAWQDAKVGDCKPARCQIPGWDAYSWKAFLATCKQCPAKHPMQLCALRQGFCLAHVYRVVQALHLQTCNCQWGCHAKSKQVQCNMCIRYEWSPCSKAEWHIKCIMSRDITCGPLQDPIQVLQTQRFMLTVQMFVNII